MISASICHSGLKGLMCILVFSVYSEGHMHMYADPFVLCASFFIFHRYNAPQKNIFWYASITVSNALIKCWHLEKVTCPLCFLTLRRQQLETCNSRYRSLVTLTPEHIHAFQITWVFLKWSQRWCIKVLWGWALKSTIKSLFWLAFDHSLWALWRMGPYRTAHCLGVGSRPKTKIVSSNEL